MGVFQEAPGMHWQQQQERYLGSAYDPSRDLSPNLPVHSCDSSSMGDVETGLSNNSSLCSSNTSSSGCSTPSSSNNNTATSSSCAVHPCSQHRYEPAVQEPPLRPKAEREPSPADDERSVTCAGCGLRIADRYYLLAVDRRWHAACLRCCQCRRALDTEVTCFSRDGNIYCKRDYHRLFGTRRCARCQAAISATELVMRARDLVFHVHCFACYACHAPLTKGDHFGMRDGAVFCRLHYQLAPSPPPPPPPRPYQPPFPSHDFHPLHHPHHHHHHHHPLSTPLPLQAPAPVGADGVPASKVPYFNGAAAVSATPRTKGRPRKRKPKDLEAMTANLDLNADFMDVAYGRSGAPGSNGQQRTKRMRTSFKHHQLRTMKSYFAINHNPDAKDLKQLSQKTGLPKRVLQVWFQNARAKWRRMVLKQEGKAGGMPGDKCGGQDPGGHLGDLEGFSHHGPSPADFRLGPGPHSPAFILGGASPPPLECT